MSEVVKKDNTFSLNSYFDKNREKIDEAIVSLRLMKEVDDFLEINHLSQRDFADKLGYSEAYISQLMTGTKKINTAFINKFEKKFALIVKFKLEVKGDSDEELIWQDKIVEPYIKSTENYPESRDNYSFKINTQNFLKIDFEAEEVEFVELS